MKEKYKSLAPHQMVQKTVNFEKRVLEAIEKRSKEVNLSESALVNLICKQVALTDKLFSIEMAEYHFAESKIWEYRVRMAAQREPVKVEAQR